MSIKNFKDKSRNEWEHLENSVEYINVGSLQRIADATEKMASNYIQLQNDVDLYKRWYNEARGEKEKLYRKISALKGVITKLKNRKP